VVSRSGRYISVTRQRWSSWCWWPVGRRSPNAELCWLWWKGDCPS